MRFVFLCKRNAMFNHQNSKKMKKRLFLVFLLLATLGTCPYVVADGPCEYNYAPVVFETDADYTFEKSGTFKIGKGVKIERGAHVKIISSEINF